MSELEKSIGFLLRLAQIRIYEQFFQTLGEYGLRPGEFSTLLVIDRNPYIRQGQLAQALHIKPAQMSKLVRGFEKQGLVRRIIPDNNRRSVELVLTEKGSQLAEQHRPAFFKLEKTSLGCLTETEKAQLKQLLRRFVDMDEEAGK